MSTLIQIAVTAAVGILIGRLAAQAHLRRLRRLLSVARHAANHDRLTGLPNRVLAHQVLAARQSRHQPTTVVLLDLDNFKHVNDRYGHHVGDAVLRSVAGALAWAAATHGGMAARLGGDEFLLLLTPTGNDPDQVVEQIQIALTRMVVVHTPNSADADLRPSASAGITLDDGDGEPAALEVLLRQADIALYHAKKHPGGRRTYTPQMHFPATPAGARLRDQDDADGIHRPT